MRLRKKGAENMIEKKTWKEFRDSGLLWFVNTILHLFGWAITVEIEKGKIINVYPVRTKFRGFDVKTNDEGYIKVTEYLKENIDDLTKEVKDEVFNNSKSCSIFIPKNKKNIEKDKIVYLCDHRACKECGSGLYCNHTHKIEHAKNFIKIGDTYFEDEKE